jgi:hypothetical protein
MLKKDISYHDLDGNPITETFWFHLSQAEMAEMAIGKEGADGGFEAWIKKLIASQNGEELVRAFKNILLATIGERSADNKSFIKSDEIRRNFEGSEAYSILFMELLTDADKMSAFVNGIVPASMRDQVETKTKEVVNSPDLATVPTAPVSVTTDIRQSAQEQKPASKDETPAWLTEGRIPTTEELKGASPEHIQEAFRRKTQVSAE